MNLSTLTHEQLEMIAEDAEEFLYEVGVYPTSHSYVNIIKQAEKEGFKIKLNYHK